MKLARSLGLGVVLLVVAPLGAFAQELPRSTLEDFRARESRAEVEPWLVLERGAFMWDRLVPSDIMRSGPFDLIDLRNVPEATLQEALADLQRFWDRNRLDPADQVSHARDGRRMSTLSWFVEQASRKIRIALADRRGAAGDPLASLRGVDGKLDMYRVVDKRSILWQPEAARLPRSALNELQRAVVMSFGGRQSPPFGELAKANDRIAALMHSRPRSWTLEKLADKPAEELRAMAEEARWTVPADADKVELLRHMTGHTAADIRTVLELPDPATNAPARPRFSLAELANLKIHEIRLLAEQRGLPIPNGMVPDKTTYIQFLTGMTDVSTFDLRDMIAAEQERQRSAGTNERAIETTRGERSRGESEGMLDVLSRENARRLREVRGRTRGRARR